MVAIESAVSMCQHYPIDLLIGVCACMPAAAGVGCLGRMQGWSLKRVGISDTHSKAAKRRVPLNGHSTLAHRNAGGPKHGFHGFPARRRSRSPCCQKYTRSRRSYLTEVHEASSLKFGGAHCHAQATHPNQRHWKGARTQHW